MKGLMNTIGVPEGMPIENKLISGQIEKAQTRVEGRNFDIRKHLVEYDDVINAHRETIYKKRNEILGIDKDKKEVDQSRLKEISLEYIKNEIKSVVKFHTQVEDESQWNLDEIYEVMDTIFSVPLEVRINIEDIKDKKAEEQDNSARPKIATYLYSLAVEKYAELEIRISSDENIKKQMVDIKEPMRMIERTLLLRSIDMLWVEHIDAMDGMRQGIGLRGYGQKDPLVEYKKEAHRMFQELLANIRKQVVYSIYKVGMVPTDDKSRQNPQMNFSGPAKTGDSSSTVQGSQSAPIKKKKEEKVGRNDPCPCGSNKKFKKCCGK